MKRPVLLIVLLCALSQPTAAHQCVLENSSAEAIQRYNNCKADLMNGTANHSAAHRDSSDQSEELARLRNEIALLKAQLVDIKRRLLALLGDL